MARPLKTDKMERGASLKLEEATLRAIAEIVAEGGGKTRSDVIRSLIKDGLEARQEKLKRGSRLGLLLLERMRLLSEARQFDLLAIADALIERQRHDDATEPPERQNAKQATPEANPPLRETYSLPQAAIIKEPSTYPSE